MWLRSFLLKAKEAGEGENMGCCAPTGTRTGPQGTWRGCHESGGGLGNLVPALLAPGGVSHSGTGFPEFSLPVDSMLALGLGVLPNL